MQIARQIDWLQARRQLAADTRPHLIELMECGNRLQAHCEKVQGDTVNAVWTQTLKEEIAKLDGAATLLSEAIATSRDDYPPTLMPPEIFNRDQATVVLCRWDFAEQLLWRLRMDRFSLRTLAKEADSEQGIGGGIEKVQSHIRRLLDTLACLWALHSRLTTNI